MGYEVGEYIVMTPMPMCCDGDWRYGGADRQFIIVNQDEGHWLDDGGLAAITDYKMLILQFVPKKKKRNRTVEEFYTGRPGT